MNSVTTRSLNHHQLWEPSRTAKATTQTTIWGTNLKKMAASTITITVTMPTARKLVATIIAVIQKMRTTMITALSKYRQWTMDNNNFYNLTQDRVQGFIWYHNNRLLHNGWLKIVSWVPCVTANIQSLRACYSIERTFPFSHEQDNWETVSKKYMHFNLWLTFHFFHASSSTNIRVTLHQTDLD